MSERLERRSPRRRMGAGGFVQPNLPYFFLPPFAAGAAGAHSDSIFS